MWGAHRLRPVVPRKGPAWNLWVGGAESVPWCDGSAQRGVSGVPRVEAPGAGGTESAPRGGPDVHGGGLRRATGGSSPGCPGPGPSWPFLILYLKGRKSALGIKVFTPLRSGNTVLLRQWGAF